MLFTIFYWGSAYTVGLVCLGLYGAVYLKNREITDLNLIFFVLNITGLTITLSLIEVLPKDNIDVMNNLSVGAFVFSSLLIFTLSRFALSVYDFGWNKILEIICAILSLFFLVLNVVAYFNKTPDKFMFPTLLVMTIAIIFSMVVLIKSNKRSHKGRKLSKFAMKITYITVFVMPVIFIIDLFPELLPFTKSFRGHMTLLPGFYFTLNVFLILSLKGQFWVEEERNIDSFISEFGISPREAEVLELLADGLSYQNIADNLSISLSTVKTHISKIYQKTETTGKMELIKAISRKY